MMAKSGMERAADLGHTAKAIYDIIKAGLKAGWQGAALAAIKAYWPKLLPIAIALVLLPMIIVCCLPAILFGWAGSSEQDMAEAYQNCYTQYEVYRDEQLADIDSDSFTIEYANDSFETNWLIAIDSVHNNNHISNMNEGRLRELIKSTYTYEVIDTEQEEDPWDDTEEESETPSKTIRVTTFSPYEAMRELNFSAENVEWATVIYNTLNDNQYSP